MNQKSRAPIDVLVVDDSALVRQTMTMLLERDRRFRVTVAADPMIAMRKISASVPDVILLDLEMPGMDGLTFMKKLKGIVHIPIVICSSLASEGSDVAVRAMEQGAIEVIAKPRLAIRDFLEESRVVLTDALLAAARSRRAPTLQQPLEPASRLSADEILPSRKSSLHLTTDKVIAIGASTGGTEALRHVLAAMPGDCPGIVVVQHMPAMFTTAFAKRLDTLCAIDVKEAASGDRVLPGRALIAPGNRHLLLQRSGAQYHVEVIDGPLVSRHRPSVDVLFRSVAQTAGPNAVGVIMTGMGDDGAAGMLEMKATGARNIAQDEASCVVFGMPREAIEAGAVHQVVSLDRMAQALVRASDSSR